MHKLQTGPTLAKASKIHSEEMAKGTSPDTKEVTNRKEENTIACQVLSSYPFESAINVKTNPNF